LGLRPGSPTKSVGSARFSTSPQTLSGRVRSGLLCVRVEEFGTGRARLCRLSGLVVSFLSSTTRTRPNTSAPATGSPTKSGPCEIPLLRLRPDQTRPDPRRTKSVHVEIERTSLRPDKVRGLVGDSTGPWIRSGRVRV